ncbi:2959_t:CDS:2 [Paraglomus occultum]|uniref:2959_t:CDS:1 n=1 Tax=Paraglomus occultum TaxID=144539 RepID=A0A9N9BS62_9GLOM|nr:2959_t:CDS:2 [Paraglomus occultum]
MMILRALSRPQIKKYSFNTHDPIHFLSLQHTRTLRVQGQTQYKITPARIPVRKPTIWKPFIFTVTATSSIFALSIIHYTDARTKLLKEIQSVNFTSPSDLNRHAIRSLKQSLDRQIQRLHDLNAPEWLTDIYTFLLTEWYSHPPTVRTVMSLILVNSAVFSLWRFGRLQPFMIRHFTHNPLSSRSYTLLTSTFSHKDLWHFAVNMIALYSFGSATATRMGSDEFLAFYLSAGIVSSFVSHASSIMLRRSRTIVPSLGASGAIYACLSACAWFYPNASVSLLFLPFLTIKIKHAVPALVCFDIFGILAKWRVFDHFAHLAGAASGIVYVLHGHEYIWQPGCDLWSSIQTPKR